MVNYYDTLKVSPKASRNEIKSAYRRLARKLHPDKNNGSEETARAFAVIAEAYAVLGDPTERAKFDQILLKAQINGLAKGDSVFATTNSHAQRWRQLIYEHRYNEIIDRMIADERRESMALQKIIFPTVALFMSTLMVAILKPQFFTDAPIVVKILLLTLFLVGVIHLVGRIREGLERYTYYDDEIHESILDDRETQAKPHSRVLAGSFLVIGLLGSFTLGLVIGQYADVSFIPKIQNIAQALNPEFFFYPPIFVLVVDLMHTFALRVEG
jgi:DnaJ-class molecular chaperone with C-terminal Zn finger domain